MNGPGIGPIMGPGTLSPVMRHRGPMVQNFAMISDLF
jgi:hypothetical protein